MNQEKNKPDIDTLKKLDYVVAKLTELGIPFHEEDSPFSVRTSAIAWIRRQYEGNPKEGIPAQTPHKISKILDVNPGFIIQCLPITERTTQRYVSSLFLVKRWSDPSKREELKSKIHSPDNREKRRKIARRLHEEGVLNVYSAYEGTRRKTEELHLRTFGPDYIKLREAFAQGKSFTQIVKDLRNEGFIYSRTTIRRIARKLKIVE